MNKIVSALLLISMFLSLFQGNAHTPQEQIAQIGWEAAGESQVSIDSVYIMRYNSRKHLSDETLDTDLYTELPSSGYCVLYHSYHGSFMDSYACFFDDSGELVLTFDYEEHHNQYETHYDRFSMYNIAAGELALKHLSECNYIAHMINYANDNQAGRPGYGKNIWYSFTENQIAWIIGD